MNRLFRSLVVLAALIPGLPLARPAVAQDEEHYARTAQPARAQELADSARYATRVTNNNLVGVTLTNYGFIGNNFVSRAPSFEYPLGKGFDHMVRGGLWIGAQAVDDQGSFTGVSTAAVDGTAGSSAQAGTEYTPASLDIRERSSLPNSPVYATDAVSEEDMIGFFVDEPARQFSPENHRPLNVYVRQMNYDWSFADYAHIVFFHYVIVNRGLPLRNVYVGLYGELASGDKKLCSSMPPSASACGSEGSWFKKKWVAYDEELRLFREHYCYNLPLPYPGAVDGGCLLAKVPYWAGYKILGAKVGADTSSVLADTSYHVTMAAWQYSPSDTSRNEDVERYAIMRSGIQDLSGPAFTPYTGDPCELLTIGPFKELDPGDSISVDFAFVGGGAPATNYGDPSEIQKHARVAQKAYDLNYVVPVPPPSPIMKVVSREHALEIYWDDSPESFEDKTSPILKDFEGYRVYVGEDRLALNLVGQYDLAVPPHDTTGFNTGLDSIKVGGPWTIDNHVYQYRYVMRGLRDGFKYFAAVTAYDLGTSEIESLESGITQNKVMAVPGPAPGEAAVGDKVLVFPNPYRVETRWDVGQKVRDHYLWFSNLPARCHLRIFTLSGDLVFDTDFNGATYAGNGARGVYDPSRELDVKAPTLSGTTYAWNMITNQGQAAATGLYLYSIEDLTGARKTAVGKFLIVKSDREE